MKQPSAQQWIISHFDKGPQRLQSLPPRDITHSGRERGDEAQAPTTGEADGDVEGEGASIAVPARQAVFHRSIAPPYRPCVEPYNWGKSRGPCTRMPRCGSRRNRISAVGQSHRRGCRTPDRTAILAQHEKEAHARVVRVRWRKVSQVIDRYPIEEMILWIPPLVGTGRFVGSSPRHDADETAA